MSAESSQEARRIAEFLLTHTGGDEADRWQAGHNYAMREAARLVREQQHLLDYGLTMPCPDCGSTGPHTSHAGGTRAECALIEDGEWAGTCGASWAVDQRGVFSDPSVTQRETG